MNGITAGGELRFEEDEFTDKDYKSLGMKPFKKTKTVKKEKAMTIEKMSTGAIVWHVVTKHSDMIVCLGIGLGLGVLIGLQI